MQLSPLVKFLGEVCKHLKFLVTTRSISKILVLTLLILFLFPRLKLIKNPLTLGTPEDLSKEEVQPVIFGFGEKLSQNDPLILSYLRKYHIYNYNFKCDKGECMDMRKLEKPKDIYRMDEYLISAFKRVLGGRRLPPGGFFIECGANDGEFLSNTIELEVNHNWTGLLIEGAPSLALKLREKRRHGWVADVCLSGDEPERIEFLMHKGKFPKWRVGNGKINPGRKYAKPLDKDGFKKKYYNSEGLVDCFPLYSILSAINVTSVDFFSLDVEGHEYKILKAIPWDKVDIKVILVEHFLAPEGKLAIKTLLIENGFQMHYDSGTDYIFVKKHNQIQ